MDNKHSADRELKIYSTNNESEESHFSYSQLKSNTWVAFGSTELLTRKTDLNLSKLLIILAVKYA